MYLVIFKLFITTDRRLRKHPFLLALRRWGRFGKWYNYSLKY